MPRAWKIIAHIERMEGDTPMLEYYLVCIPDREQAVAALRTRKGLDDAELEVRGEASPDFVDWLDIRDGQIVSVMVISG